MKSDSGSAPSAERSTPPKWEIYFLFDGTQEEAEAVLERLFDAAEDAMPLGGSSGSLMQVTDLEAWENCRCGQGMESLA